MANIAEAPRRCRGCANVQDCELWEGFAVIASCVHEEPLASETPATGQRRESATLTHRLLKEEQ